jgi:sulfur relay (sulfurtransferase) complex TusBCD TusD component (DsrE family)
LAGKKPGAKKKKVVADWQRQMQMPIVTVDVCQKCPSVCARGAKYMEKMSQPGAIGLGVPCILRRK